MSGRGGGVDGKYVILFVRKEHSLVAARSQSYRMRQEAEFDIAG